LSFDVVLTILFQFMRPINRTAIIAILAVFWCNFMSLGEEAIHEDWIEADRSFVAQVKAVLRNEPQHADRVLLPPPVDRRNLGFGYSLASHYVGKGYLGFACQMLYSNDTLVSFRLAPGMAPDNRLNAAYEDMIGDVFRSNHDGTFKPFYYNSEAAVAALPGCDAKVKMNTNMQFFCSPFSGIRYGTIGGYVGAYLENRRAYLKVADEIDGATCLRLLYSINPATRLTAYEHFLRHPVALKAVQSQVESRMRKVLEEVPRIETMKGCIVCQENSREVLNSILRTKSDTKSK
jgi:hypothetical protein